MENILYNELRYRGFNVDVGEVNISDKTESRDEGKHFLKPEQEVRNYFLALNYLDKSYCSADSIIKSICRDSLNLYFWCN